MSIEEQKQWAAEEGLRVEAESRGEKIQRAEAEQRRLDEKSRLEREAKHEVAARQLAERREQEEILRLSMADRPTPPERVPVIKEQVDENEDVRVVGQGSVRFFGPKKFAEEFWAAQENRAAGNVEPETESELARWWRAQYDLEIEKVVSKAEDYGSVDLEIMSQAMLRLKGLEPSAENRVLGLEMAVGFYALGKVARIISAHARGREAQEDSWYDLGVYARMAQKIRDTGEWT